MKYQTGKPYLLFSTTWYENGKIFLCKDSQSLTKFIANMLIDSIAEIPNGSMVFYLDQVSMSEDLGSNVRAKIKHPKVFGPSIPVFNVIYGDQAGWVLGRLKEVEGYSYEQ